ncbi:MAG: glycosyltransferase [Candidatus Marinimicrobia bacterium]|nr:glycosyltransferase [Candidatus Neomarinimicrobiota bacterium]
MKKVLIITYYWPPSGGPGVQRILKFCKYLPQHGWEPTVLTSRNGEYPALDTSLINDVKSLKVEHVKGFSFFKLFKLLTGQKKVSAHQLSSTKGDSFFSKLTRWIRYNLIFPDGKIGWYWSAVKKGKEILNDENYDLIFSTSPPHTVHLVGKTLSKYSSLPWVCDFRDPWTDRFYYQENPRNKFISFLDSLLEQNVLKRCNHLTVVSPGFLELLDSHWPIKSKSTIIYNGYDSDDFRGLKDENNLDEFISIGHIGSLSKSQNPIGLMRSIKDYNESNPPKKLLLKCIGSIHPDIEETIQANQLGKSYEKMPYMNHDKAIEKMKEFDYLFLVIPDCVKNSGIIPGKIFEYFASRSEIILIGNPDSDASKLMRKAGYTHIYDINGNIDFSRMDVKKHFNHSAIEKYNRKNQTKILANLFNSLIV